MLCLIVNSGVGGCVRCKSLRILLWFNALNSPDRAVTCASFTMDSQTPLCEMSGIFLYFSVSVFLFGDGIRYLKLFGEGAFWYSVKHSLN